MGGQSVSNIQNKWSGKNCQRSGKSQGIVRKFCFYSGVGHICIDLCVFVYVGPIYVNINLYRNNSINILGRYV